MYNGTAERQAEGAKRKAVAAAIQENGGKNITLESRISEREIDGSIIIAGEFITKLQNIARIAEIGRTEEEEEKEQVFEFYISSDH